ncbi:MAG TPA: D-alanyl-D-alanine carboxypeptidase [Clostridia bacterium]|nr:D-alanyl-D-alanine carboxypeptidase [Clostridia bacterium]
MRNWFNIILLSFLLSFAWGAEKVEATPQISAAAAIVMDAQTGEVLYQKNAFQQKAPASTTKILTAILAIESGFLDEIVTVSENAAAIGEASLHLKPGDQLLLRELVWGALLKSGNDACVAIAEFLTPSEIEFVGLMNLKAQLLGAFQTTFYNSNGLPHPYHLTTAYDLAIITRYALQNSTFRDMVATRSYRIKWLNSEKTLFVKNTNRLLWSYPEITGVKTGTTIQAGKCLVASALYGQLHLIAVVLDSRNRYEDAYRLLKYGIKIKEIQVYAK